MNTTNTKILVWDLPTRLSHWLLASGFAVAWLTGESEEWRLVHVFAGGTVVAVALFRIFWGFIGTTYARYESFVRGPTEAWQYLKSLLVGKPRHYIGHNPAGAYAILALLSLAVITGMSGWLAYQDIGGESIGELHEGAASVMLAIVGVHLLGVIVGSWKHKENLVEAMITGMKLGKPARAIRSAKPLAGAALILWATATAWLLCQ
jgi:cytochrome b